MFRGDHRERPGGAPTVTDGKAKRSKKHNKEEKRGKEGRENSTDERERKRRKKKELKRQRGRVLKRECQMQACFVARLSQRECVGNVVKCA